MSVSWSLWNTQISDLVWADADLLFHIFLLIGFVIANIRHHLAGKK
jgi:hypothetical protein